MEPQEYSDAYKPYKYGQIFKEKLFVGDNVPMSIHVSLTQAE
jgi:hypothetical protein